MGLGSCLGILPVFHSTSSRPNPSQFSPIFHYRFHNIIHSPQGPHAGRLSDLIGWRFWEVTREDLCESTLGGRLWWLGVGWVVGWGWRGEL